MIAGIAFGAGLGIFNGMMCRGFLSLALKKPDRIFYWVWVGGFAYRFLFAIGLGYVLVKNPFLPLVPTLLALILAQMLPQVWILKKGRPKGKPSPTPSSFPVEAEGGGRGWT